MTSQLYSDVNLVIFGNFGKNLSNSVRTFFKLKFKFSVGKFQTDYGNLANSSLKIYLLDKK